VLVPGLKMWSHYMIFLSLSKRISSAAHVSSVHTLHLGNFWLFLKQIILKSPFFFNGPPLWKCLDPPLSHSNLFSLLHVNNTKSYQNRMALARSSLIRSTTQVSLNCYFVYESYWPQNYFAFTWNLVDVTCDMSVIFSWYSGYLHQ
jgi:hypothetical protein